MLSTQNFDVIVYHKGCADGIMAVWAVLQHETPLYIIGCKAGDMPDIPNLPKEETSILFVDISPPSLKEFEGYKRIVVCDHHKKAIDKLINSGYTNTELIFDISRSGSQIASDYIQALHNVEVKRNFIVDHVGDRDLFTFTLPYTAELTLSFFKTSLTYRIEQHFLRTKTPLNLDEETYEYHLNLGKTLVNMQKNEIDIGCKMAKFKSIKIDGSIYKVWVSLFQQNVSELGSKLSRTEFKGKLPDFVCITTFNQWLNKWEIALRGRSDGPDLAEISSVMGGGGHHDAAKFMLSYKEYGIMFGTSEKGDFSIPISHCESCGKY